MSSSSAAAESGRTYRVQVQDNVTTAITAADVVRRLREHFTGDDLTAGTTYQVTTPAGHVYRSTFSPGDDQARAATVIAEELDRLADDLAGVEPAGYPLSTDAPAAITIKTG